MLLARELTERVIGLAIEVHRLTGSGMLESVYEGCLCYELGQAGESLSNGKPEFRWPTRASSSTKGSVLIFSWSGN